MECLITVLINNKKRDNLLDLQLALHTEMYTCTYTCTPVPVHGQVPIHGQQTFVTC